MWTDIGASGAGWAMELDVGAPEPVPPTVSTRSAPASTEHRPVRKPPMADEAGRHRFMRRRPGETPRRIWMPPKRASLQQRTT